MCKNAKGLFVTGTDTGVGKTRVAALIARALAADDLRVGVYKPAESGCTRQEDHVVANDAVALWEAAGRPGDLEHVCPQRFVAPLAPHLAARAGGRQLDPELMRCGIDFWNERSDVIVVEGAGGLMSPLGDDDYVADLAHEFGFPLVIVSANRLGTINQTLQTLIAAASFRDGLSLAGIVLNNPVAPDDDPSTATNRRELEARCGPPVLGELEFDATELDTTVDWLALAR